MVRSQDRQDRTAETLNEDDFRASAAELFQREERRKAKVAQIVVPTRRDDNDEGDNSGEGTLPSVFDFCLQAEGPDGVLKFTNFAPEEFDNVWAAVYPYLQGKWNVGRGKKCRYAARDVFFMTLSSLKHLGKWDTVARVFRIPPSTFQKMIRKFMDILSPILYEMYVEKANDQWTLGKIVRSGHAFKYFPYARYATDVTFQHANKPCGNMSEILRYYSGKHHLYGYKVEVSVLPNGVAINCTEHTGGSTHDAEIFRRNAAFHTRALHKHSSDANVRDKGRLQDKYPKEWAVLVDKGYQGMAREYRAIHPIKSGRLQPLSLEDASFNDELAHDRVIVENFFGRLKSLWGICSDKWKFDETSYDLYFRACVALTNVNIRLRPLRNDDGDDNTKYDTRLREIGASTLEKQTRKRKRYQANRQARLRTAYRRRTSLSCSIYMGAEEDCSDDDTQL